MSSKIQPTRKCKNISQQSLSTEFVSIQETKQGIDPKEIYSFSRSSA